MLGQRWIANGEEKKIVAPPTGEGPKAEPYFREPRLTVEAMDNHIWFYSDVDTDRCLDLVKKIRTIDYNLRNERLTRSLAPEHPDTPIWLHICSPGGALFAGITVMDQLKKIPTPVYSIVEGYCASAATLISMACSRRYITPSSYMLIHQLSSFAWGKYSELEDHMNLMKKLMATLTSFYISHSKLSEVDITALLERDSWFGAQECLEKGFADEIL
jgi:ATP-dependent protease ClpP protease subunit